MFIFGKKMNRCQAAGAQASASCSACAASRENSAVLPGIAAAMSGFIVLSLILGELAGLFIALPGIIILSCRPAPPG